MIRLLTKWAEYVYDRLPHAVLLNARGYSLRLQVPSDEVQRSPDEYRDLH